MPNRVFHTQFREKRFTSFALTVDDQNYLLTAAHCVHSVNLGQQVVLSYQRGVPDTWANILVELIGTDDAQEVDAAVFKLLGHDSHKWVDMLSKGDEGIVLSQEVYYVGFPSAIQYTHTMPDLEVPMPVARKGVLMAMTGRNYVIDSLAIEGFSGSPMYYETGMDGRWIVGGIITGYPIIKREASLMERHNKMPFYTDGHMTYCTPIDKVLN